MRLFSNSMLTLLCMCIHVGTRMKVHIADGVSTGDNFLHPLGEIREVLERYSTTYLGIYSIVYDNVLIRLNCTSL